MKTLIAAALCVAGMTGAAFAVTLGAPVTASSVNGLSLVISG